ncbi:MAG: hypothetical protein GOVbin556_28 [Prokaryotic dsDNA virus sp.]|nr:MAG: hypothetical protein GOVbin556_28 [Prokaryotic dsDNA virus sp.]
MIFDNIQQLRDCMIEVLPEIIPPRQLDSVISYIDKIKQLDLQLETKEVLCNSEIRKVLIKNKIVPSYEIKDWLHQRREEYLELMEYVKRDNEWKTKHNIDTE